jgi:two-component system, cell cycle response regulator
MAEPKKGAVIADTVVMAQAQDRMPAGAKLATGAIIAALALLAAHNALGVAWPAFPAASWWDYLYNVIEFAAVALCGARVLVRRRDRGAWAAVTIGLLLFSAGDLYYSLAFGADASSVPTPSLADAMYLSFYPAAYIGIGLLVRARVRELPAALWLDGLIGSFAVAAIGATFVFPAVLSDTRGAPLAVATNLAYPLADLLLLAVIIVIFVLSGWKLRGEWLVLAAGFAVFAVADSIYLLQSADDTYVANGLLDVGWPGAMAIVAFAAWRPSLPRRAVRTDGWGIFAAPAAAAVVCLGLEFYDHYIRLVFAAHVFAILCLLTVIVRLGLSFAQNLSMLRTSRHEAITDALTGLGNRRALKLALEARLAAAPVEPFVVAFYDLDGFKYYNDTFGHQAGDALLARLGARMSQALPDAGVFRMGGDEFCLLASDVAGGARLAALAADCLHEHGSSFSIGCSYGVVGLPGETQDVETAMVLADARMYAQKEGRRPNAAAESQRVLLRALAERSNELGQHNDDVAELVEAVARELGLQQSELVPVRRAAELHDVGKLAIPDTILEKPGPLDEQEWGFMRGHTLVGERIVASATSLRDVAPIVRSTHERWDGGGYPDGLAGEEIPLGARIIAVCDAFDAMTTERPYSAAVSEQEALIELRRCTGTQFDPTVVAAFERVLARGGGSVSAEEVAA